jgi:hypothetical protein
MSNEVYANMMEISCKQAAGKSICAMPDVCFTPPENPATPPGVPVPYPNTGMASDTTDGSTTVKISEQEVMLKNKSYFKKSTGDEAGCAAKKGVVTSKNMGKVYFNAWSMDVQVESENVVRNLDLTTHNHGSVPGNTTTWPYVDEANTDVTKACENDMKKEKKICEGVEDPCAGFKDKPDKLPDSSESEADVLPESELDVHSDSPKKETKRKRDGPPDSGEGKKKRQKVMGNPKAREAADEMSDRVTCNDCLNARRCKLSPYSGPLKSCCDGQTPHHIVEKASFTEAGGKSKLSGCEKYDPNLAPCVCAEGTSQAKGGTHELMHVFQKADTLAEIKGKPKIKFKFTDNKGETRAISQNATTYKKSRETGIKAFQKVFVDAGCDPDCIRKQLDAYHKQCDITDETVCKAVTEGPAEKERNVKKAEAEIARRSFLRMPESFSS